MKTTLLFPVIGALALAAGCASPAKTEEPKASAATANVPAIDVTLPPLSTTELGLWVMDYYKKPDPQHLIPRTAQYCVLAASEGQSVKPAQVFLSEAVRIDPSRAGIWADEIVQQPGGRLALCEGMWMSGDSRVISAIKRIQPKLTPPEQSAIDAMLRRTVPNVRTMPILAYNVDTSLVNLDANWAAFFATGAEWPINRVYALLKTVRPELNAQDFAKVRSAAVWSLVSISKAHPKVAEVIQSRMPSLTPELRQMLEASLASGAAPPK